MEILASGSAAGTSSAQEAGRRLALPPSSIRNILHAVLNQYPYKLQSWHKLLPSDTVEREAFVRWALSKIAQDSSWVFNILWTDEAHFSLHGDVNTITVASGRRQIHECTQRNHCILPKSQCGMGSRVPSS